MLLSFSAGEAEGFVAPVADRTTTFLVEGRGENLALARAVVAHVTKTGRTCSILDLDAFYASNAGEILSGLPPSSLHLLHFTVPDPNSSVDAELPRVLSSPADVLIIDSFNTFYHLLSYDGGASGGRKLSFAVASMSYLARTVGRAAFFSMYRRGGSLRQGSRSISDLSDVTVTARIQGSEVSLTCERGKAWPGGRLSIRIP